MCRATLTTHTQWWWGAFTRWSRVSCARLRPNWRGVFVSLIGAPKTHAHSFNCPSTHTSTHTSDTHTHTCTPAHSHTSGAHVHNYTVRAHLLLLIACIIHTRRTSGVGVCGGHVLAFSPGSPRALFWCDSTHTHTHTMTHGSDIRHLRACCY